MDDDKFQLNSFMLMMMTESMANTLIANNFTGFDVPNVLSELINCMMMVIIEGISLEECPNWINLYHL